jgi:hypothetical protein
MSVLYKIQIRNASGQLLAEIDDYQDLTYTIVVNAPGVAEFSIGATSQKAQYIVIDNRVEVYRKNVAYGITQWVQEFSGFIRSYTLATQRGSTTFVVTALGILDILNQRIVAYYADTAQRSLFINTNVETIMKTIVSYNCGANATTANGRLRNGVISGLTVDTDTASSVFTIDWANAWKPVLKDLQDLSVAYRMDFDLTPSYVFTTYANQRGTDRTTEFTFSLENGNMTDPVYTYDATNERSVALVGEQGEQDDRNVYEETGSLYHVVTNNREVFVDARNTDENTNASLYLRAVV